MPCPPCVPVMINQRVRDERGIHHQLAVPVAFRASASRADVPAPAGRRPPNLSQNRDGPPQTMARTEPLIHFQSTLAHSANPPPFESVLIRRSVVAGILPAVEPGFPAARMKHRKHEDRWKLSACKNTGEFSGRQDAALYVRRGRPTLHNLRLPAKRYPLVHAIRVRQIPRARQRLHRH